MIPRDEGIAGNKIIPNWFGFIGQFITTQDKILFLRNLFSELLYLSAPENNSPRRGGRKADAIHSVWWQPP